MTRRPAQHSPDTYMVDEGIREWAAERWGLRFLPDAFLRDWQDKARAKGFTYSSLGQAFRNYIRWASPGGSYHTPREWEAKCRLAKAREPQQRMCKPARYMQPADEPRSAAEVARAAIAGILERMG